MSNQKSKSISGKASGYFSRLTQAATDVVSEAVKPNTCCRCEKDVSFTKSIVSKGLAAVGAKKGLVHCVCCLKYFCDQHSRDGIHRRTNDVYFIPESFHAECYSKSVYYGIGKMAESVSQQAAKTAYRINAATLGACSEYACNEPNPAFDGLTCKQFLINHWVTQFSVSMENALRVETLCEYLRMRSDAQDPVSAETKLTIAMPAEITDSFAVRALITTVKGADIVLAMGALSGPYAAALLAIVGGVKLMAVTDAFFKSLGVEGALVDVIKAIKGPIMLAINSGADVHKHAFTNDATSTAVIPVDGTAASSKEGDDSSNSDSSSSSSSCSNKPAARTAVLKQAVKEIIPAIYYLHCKHNMDVVLNARVTIEGGVDCPTQLIDHVGTFVGVADWLYSCKLPGVYNTSAWNTWYLQRVVEKTNINGKGWTLVGCSQGSKHVPIFPTRSEIKQVKGKEQEIVYTLPCLIPAFGVFIRAPGATGGGRAAAGGEVLIIVRGTQSIGDAITDVTDAPEPFEYHRHLAATTNLNTAAATTTNTAAAVDGTPSHVTVSGVVHGGMYRAADAIIQYSGVGKMMDSLVQNGFRAITVVGHSLGGGTATIIAMLLKARLLEHFYPASPLPPLSIQAITYGTPAVVSPGIAVALKEDNLVIAVVNRSDIVPRISQRNIYSLATEVADYRATAKQYEKRELKELKERLKALGKTKRRVGGDQTSSPDGKASASIDADGDDSSDQPITVLQSADATAAQQFVAQVKFDQQPAPQQQEEQHQEEEGGGVDASAPSAPPVLSLEEIELFGTEEERDAECLEYVEALEVMPAMHLDQPLVLPGAVIYLHENSSRQVQATLCDYSAAPFQEMKLSSKAVSDHSMFNYINTFRNLRMSQTHQQQQQENSNRFDKPPKMVPASMPDGSWTPCQVCETDCTHVFITSGPSARAAATKNCMACGAVVCPACAPAGDVIPAEGVGSTQTLRDMRLSLPHVGRLEPQRVCLPCYYSSYNL